MQITIIGAGPGISQAVSRLFGSKGYKVALIARNAEKLEAEVAQLRADGIEAIYAVADASSENSLSRALDQINESVGEAAMILYNAFAPAYQSLEQETWESIQHQFNTNVGGAFQLLKKVLPSFKKQNGGKLFFTGGGLALYPQPGLVGLSMGKAALRNLVLGTAEGLKGTNVHVATLTITGFVHDADPKYNAAAIAEQYWSLFCQKPDEFVSELIY